MKKVLGLLFFSIIFFSLYITRDGKLYTPTGEGEVVLDSGTYEAFTLPEYASGMINSDYKSYIIEVEKGIKVHGLENCRGFPVF